MEIMRGIFQNLGTLSLQGESARTFLAEIFLRFLIVMAPIMLTVAVVGIAANLIQVGFLFTFEPFKPKFDKFNPIAGMKKFVSLRSLMDLVKSFLKIVYIGIIAWFVLRSELDSLPALIDMSVGQILGFIGITSLKVMFYVSLAMAVLAAVDFAYQRWQHHKDLMMTKQEVKDEHKQAEGDPKVKSRIRQMQRQMASRRMMSAVPNADVVITNPTHLAIAIQYNAEEMFAPQIVPPPPPPPPPRGPVWLRKGSRPLPLNMMSPLLKTNRWPEHFSKARRSETPYRPSFIAPWPKFWHMCTGSKARPSGLKLFNPILSGQIFDARRQIFLIPAP